MCFLKVLGSAAVLALSLPGPRPSGGGGCSSYGGATEETFENRSTPTWMLVPTGEDWAYAGAAASSEGKVLS